MERRSGVYGTPWQEDEYILALDVYAKHRGQPLHQNVPHVQRLSRLIGRTPDAVAMRLENFASMDPREAHRRGLANIGPTGQRVVREWIDSEICLSKCAAVLKRQRKEDDSPLFVEAGTPKVFFGKYELEDHWREGGFATIYSCRRVSDGKLFALKVLKSEPLTRASDTSVDRFRREVRLLREVRHPRIIEMYEDNLDEEPSTPGYVMELADHSLSEYLAARGTRSPGEDAIRPALGHSESREIFLAVCEGVEVLHGQPEQLIHRDINPSNVLHIAGRGWVLGDFGLAKFLATHSGSATFATSSERGMGTFQYTAPEQWKNLQHAAVPADVHSMGVLLWELFTSAGAFRTDSLCVPRWLEPVIRKAVEYAPEARHASVAALRSDFELAFTMRA